METTYQPVILLLGPPGAGKGTFSQHLKDNFGYLHVSVGDLVRREIDQKTPFGLEVEATVKQGKYIDSKGMDELIEKAVGEVVKKGSPIILDGFVHNENDLKALCLLLDQYELHSRVVILYLKCNDEICRGRIAGRLICSKCSYIYNSVSHPPIVKEKCNYCHSMLKKRLNDTSAVIEKRIKEFREEVIPNYDKALTMFPSIFFDSSAMLSDCLEFYENFARRQSCFKNLNK